MEKNIVKYYAGGEVKTVNGIVYSRYKGSYVLDFYHDDDDLVKPENECSEEDALKEFVSIYGTDVGFHDHE